MAQAVRIPANDLKRPFELHAAEYEKKALEVLRSGWYILGKEVASFEEAFAAYLGVKCCVGLACWASVRGMRSSSAQTPISPV